MPPKSHFFCQRDCFSFFFTFLPQVRFYASRCVASHCVKILLLLSRHILLARHETILLMACYSPAVIVKCETQNRYAIACRIIGAPSSHIVTRRNTTHVKASVRDRPSAWSLSRVPYINEITFDMYSSIFSYHENIYQMFFLWSCLLVENSFS